MTRDEQWLLDEKYGGKETQEYESDKKRLSEGEPLGYVIGWQPFLGLKIYLDSKPLIPRPETEWWTEKMLCLLPEDFSAALQTARPSFTAEKSSDSKHIKFLDLCAGSGAIGCAALAQLPQAQVYFGEVDSAHESTIKKNFNENNLDCSRTAICIGNLFEPFGDIKFDAIAVNPPYIPKNRTLPESVVRYEPTLALFAGKDGLDFIRRIAEELPKRLTKKGVAWIECDSKYAKVAYMLFKNQGLKAEILADQYNKPRVICVKI